MDKKVAFARIEIRQGQHGLTAWVDGKLIGRVTAAEPDQVCIHVVAKCLGKGELA